VGLIPRFLVEFAPVQELGFIHKLHLVGRLEVPILFVGDVEGFLFVSIHFAPFEHPVRIFHVLELVLIFSEEVVVSPITEFEVVGGEVLLQLHQAFLGANGASGGVEFAVLVGGVVGLALHEGDV